MCIYIIFLILILIMYIILYKIKYNKYSKIIFCSVIFILFTLIQGLRAENVGSDTSKYIQYYLRSENISFIDVITKQKLNFEIGFGILMKVLSSMHIPPQVFLLIVSAIINGRSDVFYIQTIRGSISKCYNIYGNRIFYIIIYCVKTDDSCSYRN